MHLDTKIPGWKSSNRAKQKAQLFRQISQVVAGRTEAKPHVFIGSYQQKKA